MNKMPPFKVLRFNGTKSLVKDGYQIFLRVQIKNGELRSRHLAGRFFMSGEMKEAKTRKVPNRGRQS
jgi:hypothetical protein